MSILDPRQVYTYFLNHFQVRKSTNNWHKFDCPHCDRGRGKQKAAVKFEWERIKCWECGFTSWIIDFVGWAEGINFHQVMQLLHTYDITELDLDYYEGSFGGVQDVKIDLPIGYKGLTSDGAMGKRARSYLEKRGFDIEELDFKGFGYCSEHNKDDPKESYFGYIIVPFKSKGELIYFQGRDFIGNEFRFKFPAKEKFGIGRGDCIYNEDALYMEDINFSVEGWADAETLGSMGTATQGWSLSARQRMLMLHSNCSKQVFIPDIGLATDGVSYYKKALQLALDFVDIKDTYVLDLRELGVNGKDVNDIGAEPIFGLFEKADPYPLTHSDIILKLI